MVVSVSRLVAGGDCANCLPQQNPSGSVDDDAGWQVKQESNEGAVLYPRGEREGGQCRLNTDFHDWVRGT